MVIQGIKAFGAPYLLFILTGGDSAKRSDIFDIIAYAHGEGLRIAMTPSATPLISRDAVRRFAAAGLVRLALSLDGKDPLNHDSFRRVAGSFTRTLQILDWCRVFGLETQVHTTVTRHVLDELPTIAETIGERELHSAIYPDRLLTVLLCRNDLSETFIFGFRIARVEQQCATEVMMVSDRNGEGSFEIRSFRRSYQSQRLSTVRSRVHSSFPWHQTRSGMFKVGRTIADGKHQ
jgi:hypothetical protein